MKFCYKCGTQLNDNAEFCVSCGTRQMSVTDSAGNTLNSTQQPAGYDQYTAQGTVPVNMPGNTLNSTQQPAGYDQYTTQGTVPDSMSNNIQNNMYTNVQAAMPNNNQVNMPQPPQYSQFSGQDYQQAMYNAQADYSMQQNAFQLGGIVADPNYGYDMNSGRDQGGDQSGKDGRKNKKKSKKKIVIPLVIVLLIGLGVGGFFILKAVLKSPQEKMLDEFFEAIEDMDIAKLEKIYKPADSPRSDLINEDQGMASLIVRRFGFTRGGILENADYVKFNSELMDMWLNSYGFKDTISGGTADKSETDAQSELFKKKYKDFKVDYEIVSIGNASEYRISRMNGIDQIQVDDMAELISTTYKIDKADIEEVDVAKLHIKWNYGDKKYGYDKSWWNNETFKNIVAEHIRDTKGRILGSYDEVVVYQDNLIYNAFLYKYKGKWYIYNPYIINSTLSQGWIAE
ncbi:hypothetical protein SAMN04487934_10247 [Eubacterium ruminantium]|nr:hypothetical protein SAMN04487934_10247 [Eubacterium ruminantium]